jgi:hypothetical protein
LDTGQLQELALLLAYGGRPLQDDGEVRRPLVVWATRALFLRVRWGCGHLVARRPGVRSCTHRAKGWGHEIPRHGFASLRSAHRLGMTESASAVPSPADSGPSTSLTRACGLSVAEECLSTWRTYPFWLRISIKGTYHDGLVAQRKHGNPGQMIKMCVVGRS